MSSPVAPRYSTAHLEQCINIIYSLSIGGPNSMYCWELLNELHHGIQIRDEEIARLKAK